jgi:hypothetical protein
MLWNRAQTMPAWGDRVPGVAARQLSRNGDEAVILLGLDAEDGPYSEEDVA